MSNSPSDDGSHKSRPKGLWAMMGQSAAASDEAQVDSISPSVPHGDMLQSEASDAARSLSPSEQVASGNDADASPSPLQEKVSSNQKPQGRRGLWDLMGNVQTPALQEKLPDDPNVTQRTVDRSHEDQVDIHDAGEDASATKSQTQQLPKVSGPRGLFSLMQRAKPGDSPPEETSTSSGSLPESHSAPKSFTTKFGSLPAGKDTFDDIISDVLLEQSEQKPFSKIGASSHEDIDDDHDAENAIDSEEEEEEELIEPVTPAFSIGRIDLNELEPLRVRKALIKSVRQSWMAVFWGLASITASAIALIEFTGNGVPAGMFGFGALFAGYSAMTGSVRTQIGTPTRVVSIVGMMLGISGIFLAPLFFAPLGRDMRISSELRETGKTVERIGTGLKQHYDKFSAYPVGGTFTRDSNGEPKGQHGWMTFLLPFVGEQGLHASIKLDLPYDDQANRAAMSRNVPAYFSSLGDQSKIVGGFAVSHFAGVGGEINEAGILAHLGIFERDEAVKREEVTDGLANTLIVGELGRGFPPWGDPENWRQPGKGINRDPNGFGSANRRGATFLIGDGSVRTLSNDTDPQLLRKLSTRDGSE